MQLCRIKNALRLLIETIPKAGPGTMNALDKQTPKWGRNQWETSHRSFLTNLMNTVKPAALYLPTSQKLQGVFHSFSEGKDKNDENWCRMTPDTFGSVMRKKWILKCKKQKAIQVGLEKKKEFHL